ncbi:MAG: nucleotidyltransferase domain-containing protein [Candidatus Thiodiazotropha sp. DIVDIV]
MDSYYPKDFVETTEGLIFAVVTEDQEDQRILSSLRYQRTANGYKKLSTDEAETLLQNSHPQYRYYSSTRDVWLHGVHQDRIVYHHQPRLRLQEILQTEPNDQIEAKLQRLIEQLKQHGLEAGEIGVTGSMLIGAQKKSSDIDLVFYQRKAFFTAREIIKTLISTQQLQPLDETLWQDAYARRGCALSYDEYCWHENRKYNKAAIEHTKFDISLLTPDRWQDLIRYRKQGRFNIKANIVNDRHRFDYPARYTLNHPAVKEAVSYTATYAGQAIQGEQVEIQGQLEVSIAGHLRIVIGTNREASHEYIKTVSSQHH